MLYQISYKIRVYVEDQIAKVVLVSFIIALIIKEAWDSNGRWPK